MSPCKQGWKTECHAVDDEGVHVAALALAEASKRGGSPQISRTPSRRRHLRYSPAPSGEKKVTINDFVLLVLFWKCMLQLLICF